MPFWLPFGIDTADGVTEIPPQPRGIAGPTKKVGTATPDGARFVYENTAGAPQQDTSGYEIERAEQCTTQSQFKFSSLSTAISYLGALGRGTFVTDSIGYIYRVLSSKVNLMDGGAAALSVTTESISFDSPPDDFQCVPVELGINIIKHPRYFYALYPQTVNELFGNQDDFTTVVGTAPNQATVAQVKQALIRAIQTYQDSPFFPSADSINGLVQNNVIKCLTTGTVPTQVTGTTVQVDTSANASCLLALAAASEIIQKLWNQLENPYMAGFQITWSQYYFAPVYLNPGSYVENPVGIVPDYFLSPSQDGTNTIFDQLAAINPQCYSLDGTQSGDYNISWLRKADEVEYQRTWFKVTRTWIGSPIGHWDEQIFSQNDRPTTPSEYLPLV